MVEIRTLTTFQVDDLARIMPGYTSREKYEVHQDVSADDETIRFFLRRVALREPCVKRWDYDADEILRGGARPSGDGGRNTEHKRARDPLLPQGRIFL